MSEMPSQDFKRPRLASQCSLPAKDMSHTLECENENHQRRFRERINDIWSSNEFCDVTLVSRITMEDCEKVKTIFHKMCTKLVSFGRRKDASCPGSSLLVDIHVNSLVVASMSPTLHQMIRNGKPESNQTKEIAANRNGSGDNDFSFERRHENSVINLCKTSIDGFSLVNMVRYMYKGILEISSENVEKTLNAAHVLQVKGAVDLCADFFLEGITYSNALTLKRMGRVYECGGLEEEASTFVCENFKYVTAEKEWLYLTKDDLEEILMKNDLVCETEMDVVKAAYSWATASSQDIDKANSLNSDSEPNDRKALKKFDSSSAQGRLLCLTEFFRSGLVRLAYLSEDDLLKIKSGSFFSKEKQKEYPKEHGALLKQCEAVVDIQLQLYDETCKRVKIDDVETDSDLAEQGELNKLNKLTQEPRKYDYVGGALVTSNCIIRSLDGHSGYVYTVKEIDDDILASGSRDHTINIWDKKLIMQEQDTKPIPILTLEEHRDRVVKLWSFKNSSSKILFASCSFDNTIRIWEWDREKRTCNCIKVLEGHENWVTSITTCANKLVTGSADNTIKLWNIDTFECENTIIGHRDHVYGLCRLITAAGTELLASSSMDKTVKIWDPSKNWECVRTLKGHGDSVRCVFAYGDMLISGAADGTIIVWSTGQPWKMMKVLTGHTGVVEALSALPRTDASEGNGPYKYLVSASRDNSIKMWDINSYKCERTLIGHKNWVKGLAVTRSGNLVSASADSTVKIWKTDEF